MCPLSLNIKFEVQILHLFAVDNLALSLFLSQFADKVVEEKHF